MEHFQAALDPRKQELLEARFLGAKVYYLFLVFFYSNSNLFYIVSYLINI